MNRPTFVRAVRRAHRSIDEAACCSTPTRTHRGKPWRLSLALIHAILVAVAVIALPPEVGAQTPPPPPPPPPPSASSMVGDTVTNPLTGMTTTVSGLIVDPDGTPTAGATAFVQTADGDVFLVKATGEIIYNRDSPPLAFVIVGPAMAAN